MAIGASLLGAGVVVAMDIDDSALQVLQENVEDMEISGVDAIQCDFLNSKVCR